jgi:Tfp pilus assembly protein PilP
MSGAFEVAPGAFAVVGVSDILIRTGRFLYGFLGNITDVPEEMIRLREIIKETTTLYAASTIMES